MTTSTQEALLKSALNEFAANGYNGASTRAIATRAKANVSAIPYYFSGKERLYRATLEYIAKVVEHELQSSRTELQQLLESPQATPEALRKALHDFLGSMLQMLAGKNISPAMAQIFIREQLDPTPAFDTFYQQILKKVHTLLTLLFARISGLQPKSEEAIVCTHAILGQVVVFKTHQELALRRLGWDSCSEEQLQLIHRVIKCNVDAILDHYCQRSE